MKFRNGFVTNSSSSSFVVTICINKKDGGSVSFVGNGGTPDCGRIDYFDDEAIISVSPKQLGMAKTVDEMIQLLTDGVLDESWSGDAIKIFAESNPVMVSVYDEDFDFEEEKTIEVDAYDFIRDIRDNIHSMDDVESITITGEESNYMEYNQSYTYNRVSGEYTGQVLGCEFEKDGSSGGVVALSDLDTCNITHVDPDGHSKW